MADDDRFRGEDSRYRDDEVVALARVGERTTIDWSGPEKSPESTLWLPEGLFRTLVAGTLLGGINIYRQVRLTREQCAELSRELAAPRSGEREDVAEARRLVADLAGSVASAKLKVVLLVEGP
jgi:hypothetical protein